MLKQILLKAVLSAYIALVAPLACAGGGGMIVFDPSNFSVNQTTSLKMVSQVINSLRQVQNQIRLIEYQVKNTNIFSSQQWQDASSALQEMRTTIQQGNSISYAMSNLQDEFVKLYPGYSDSPFNQVDFPKKLKALINTGQKTLNNALQALSVSSEQLRSEKAFNSFLHAQAQSTQGRLQALSLGNEIASQQISQTQKLREVMMAQTNAQVEYMAYKTQMEANQHQQLREFGDNADDTWPGYKGDPRFAHLKVPEPMHLPG